MKRTNKKLWTLIFAGAFCATAIGGVSGLTQDSVSAYSPSDPKTYTLTNVFSVKESGAEIGAAKMNESDAAETATFTYTGGGAVEFNRDLAFKWYTAKDEVRYTNIDVAFGEFNFKSVSFAIQTNPAESIVGDYSTNTIQFVYDNGSLKAGVLYGEEKDTTNFVTLENATAKTALSITLSEEGTSYGEFGVLINGTAIGKMVNVGKNFSDTSSMDTLVISADVEKDVKTTVYLSNLNGQSFNNVKESSGVKAVADTAAPVLVVNEELSSFSLGSAFSLAYEKIDVLQSSSISETKKYHQYNPAVNPSYETSLTTSTYFMDTVYYYNETTGEYSKDAKDGFVATSVYRELGAEYVSIQFTLGDDTFTGDDKVTYDLAWYVELAEGEELFSQTWTETTGEGDAATSTEKTTYYITVDRNENAPAYTYITAGYEDENGKFVSENKVDEALENAVAEYETAIAEKAEKIYAGSNAELQLPAVDWLITDNNGYQNLVFTISYYKPDSTSASTASSLDYDELEIPTNKAGSYEFKILAKDKSGNAMKYYLDGELVEVTTSNVWDIEEIPSFKFKVKDGDISIEDGEDNDTLDTKILEEKYTFKDVTIVGASSESSAYKLFIVNMDSYNSAMKASGDDRLTLKVLSSIKYEALQDYVAEQKESEAWGNAKYFDIYKEAYVNAIANKLGVADNETALTALRGCLKEVAEYDDRISKDDKDAWNASDNKYAWNASEASFTAAEEGIYLILADYWDAELAYYDRVVAYKVVEVAAAVDVIRGETEWLKNNLVSVILFSIAGVMLILIIILLLIKPSDETLEDVDEKAAKEKKATKKENKKQD